MIFNAVDGAPCRAPDGSIALRCPDHELTQTLIRETGGVLASTSANRTGTDVVMDADTARDLFRSENEELVVILDRPDGEEPRETASTLVDCRGERPILVRKGALPAGKLGLE